VAVLVNVWVIVADPSVCPPVAPGSSAAPTESNEKAYSGTGSIEQWGQASLYIDKNEKMKDKDLMKKATTDGITKCLSCMGFNADIFLGKFEDNKYVQQMTAEHAPKPVFAEGMLESMREKFTAAIATNERTADQIISKLEEAYTVCDTVKKSIRGIK
jgi:hypothetical protein